MTPKEKMPRTPNVNSAARKPVEQLDVIARKTGPINGKTGIEVHLRQTSPSQLRTDIVHLQKRWDEEEAKSEVSKIETVSKLELGKSRIGKDISIPKK